LQKIDLENKLHPIFLNVPFKNIKPWRIRLVRNNQTTLFPIPPKKNHFEKQKRNLHLSLNIPLVPFGKGEK